METNPCQPSPPSPHSIEQAQVDEASRDKCVVCLEPEKTQGSEEGVSLKEVRCAHAICIDCFDTLAANQDLKCPECRRPIIADRSFELLEGLGEWFVARHRPGRRRNYVDVHFAKSQVYSSLVRVCNLTEIGAQEVLGLLRTELTAVNGQVNTEIESDSGMVVFGPRNRAASNCVDFISTDETKERVRALLMGAIDRVVDASSKRMETINGVVTPLLTEESGVALKQLAGSHLDEYIEITCKKHECLSVLRQRNTLDVTYQAARELRPFFDV